MVQFSGSTSVYPSVPWNRCQFHLSKNAQQYARRKRDKPRIAQAMRDIFDAPSREDAEELKGKVVKKFGKDCTGVRELAGRERG